MNLFRIVSHTQSVTSADFNGDGLDDLATAGGTIVSILIGNGDGSFQLPLLYYSSSGYYAGSFESITTGDFNKDGKIDLATGNWYDSTSVFIGNGDGTFQPEVDYPAGRAAAVITGDFNSDGNLDIATANVINSISIVLGNGDGTFQFKGNFTTEDGPPWSLATGDFNDDGKPDIAISNGSYYNGSISILLGNGDGTFEAKAKYPAQPLGYNGGCFINSGDFNNDGKTDLVSGNGSILSILLNTYKKDDTPPTVELFTDPSVLWPPDHKMVNVFIGGRATDDESGVASVVFTVTDEYGSIKPVLSGFNSTIQLEAWRDGSDKDGRTYTITAIATDAAGNSTTATTVVLVPHDQR